MFIQYLKNKEQSQGKTEKIILSLALIIFATSILLNQFTEGSGIAEFISGFCLSISLTGFLFLAFIKVKKRRLNS